MFLAEREILYIVTKIIREGSEIRREELFLSLTSTELREREPTNGRTIGSWALESLESAARVKDNEIHLVFDTIRRDRKERFYELDVKEAVELYEVCRGELESRSLLELRQIPFRCLACLTSFSVEKRPKWQGKH